MKFRVGACALLVCLAGCSGKGPNSDFAELRGAAATKSAAGQLPKLQLGRTASKSIANAPDRGALVSYQNKGAPTKREGAYTFYPVAISEDHALKALVTGEITVPSPDGSQVKLRYERHEEHPDGNWSWIGRVEGGNPLQEAIITFGEKAVFASIPQANGQGFEIETRNGALYAVQVDRSKIKSGNTGHTDMLVPEASAIRDAAAKVQAAAQAQTQAQVAQAAVAQNAPPTSANTVDVAIGYTPAFRTKIGSQSGAVTRLTQLITVANQGLANSKINGYLRLVTSLEVAYVENNTNQAALRELTGHTGTSPVTVPASLVPLRTARDQHGADIALLVRNFQRPEHEGCGIAWLIGADRQEIVPSADSGWAYAVISDGWDENYFCADETLAHESAHLMGSAHDAANSKNADGSQLYGRYDYSFGYKPASFFTIMAYGDDAAQTSVRMFSNPSVATCGTGGASACGVVNQADNARSLNQTIPVVARFRTTVVPFAGLARNDVTGDGRSDLIFRNASAQLVGWWEMNGTTWVKSGNQAAGGSYTLSATGDFNGDGRIDLVWTNVARKLVIFLSTGSAFTSVTASNDFGAGWTLIGAGDITGDGKSDLIFRNISSQLVGWWEMNGAARVRAGNRTVSSGFTLNAIGDFNGDGKTDLAWTNAARQLVILTSTGTALNATLVSNDFGSDWTLIGAGDITGDGNSDLIFRNVAAQLVGWWEMNGTTPVRSGNQVAGGTYTVGAIGDFNGDGRADLVWTNAVRKLVMFTSTGSAFTSATVSHDFGAGWSLERGGP